MKTYQLDLLAVPNQSFNTTLNGNNILIELRTFRNVCYMSISQDGEYLLAGVKCLPNVGLLTPSLRRYLNGDLKFYCNTDDYPSYTNFGTLDCRLIYEANE